MEFIEQQNQRRMDRSLEVALFRYLVIQDLTVPGLSARQRGRLAREIAKAEHIDPSGNSVTVSRHTLDRWARAWRRGGVAALAPAPRRCVRRTPAEILHAAEALKREQPGRTAAQICRILRQSRGWSPTERTLQRYFAELGLNLPPVPQSERPRRFDAREANELWTGDALPGPRICGRDTFLYAFMDDHSRAVVGHRFAFADDYLGLAAALRPALAARGVPGSVHVDHGSPFVAPWLLRACATLAIRLVHSNPGLPSGRGRLDAFLRTVREDFVAEFDDAACEQIRSLGELNWLFTAWTEAVYHRAVHPETGRPPIEHWLASVPRPLPLPTAEQLREAFLWSEPRTATSTATVSLQGRGYQLDPALARRRVELVFDPFDLTDIEVHYRGRPMGRAVTCESGEPARSQPHGAGDAPHPGGSAPLGWHGS